MKSRHAIGTGVAVVAVACCVGLTPGVGPALRHAAGIPGAGTIFGQTSTERGQPSSIVEDTATADARAPGDAASEPMSRDPDRFRHSAAATLLAESTDRFAAFEALLATDGPPRGEARYYAAQLARECEDVRVRGIDGAVSDAATDPLDERRLGEWRALKSLCQGFAGRRDLPSADELLAQSRAAGFPAAMADGLAPDYAAGRTSPERAVQLAGALVRSGDPRVIPGVSAYLALAYRRAGGVIDGRALPRREHDAYVMAWTLVGCRLGAQDCSANSTGVRYACARDAHCDLGGVETLLEAISPPPKFERASRYAERIAAALDRRDLAALGLDRSQPILRATD